MRKYDFSKLGWHSFEQLVLSLLKETIHFSVSSFSGSADQGRDATYSGTSSFQEGESYSGDWIFQVKYKDWDSRGTTEARSELVRDFKNEFNKVVKKYQHKCDIYVFITNVPLTARDKDKIAECNSSNKIKDVIILGYSDIEQLLNSNPKVFRAFPALMGIGQLKEIINQGIAERSRLFLEKAYEEVSLFVVTRVYLEALDKLKKENICVLSGPPKMGKTCTTSVLAASYIAEGFTVIEVRSQEEFFSNLNRDEKQLFICDDVFGQIAMDSAKKNDWTEKITQLLKALGKKTKLIWTTRVYILKEVLQSTELNEDYPKLDTNLVTVDIYNLSYIEKAQILYNHVKNSSLPEKIKKTIKKNAYSICESNRFSPEAIRQICTGEILKCGPSVVDDILKFFKTPSKVFNKIYGGFSQDEKDALCILMAIGGGVDINRLCHLASKSGGKDKINKFLKTQDGFLIKLKADRKEKTQVYFHHPSIKGFLIEKFSSNKIARKTYIENISISEVASIMSPPEETDPALIAIIGESNSMAHKLTIRDKDEIDLFLSHFKENILPKSSLYSIIVLMQNFSDLYKNGAPEDRLINESFSLFTAFLCESSFWTIMKKNKLTRWNKFFSYLHGFLIYGEQETILYAKEFIEHFSVEYYNDFSYWQTINFIKKINPIAVEKYTDFEKRHCCLEYLSERAFAILEDTPSSTDPYDMDRDDCDECRYWIDESTSLCLIYNLYIDIFPQDTDYKDSSGDRVADLFDELQSKIDSMPDPDDVLSSLEDEENKEIEQNNYYRSPASQSIHQMRSGYLTKDITEEALIADIFNDL